MNISFYLIPKSEVCYVYEDDTAEQALHKIHKKGFQAVPVINKEGAYTGTVTEGDFLRMLTSEAADPSCFREARVADIHKKWHYKSVSIDARISELDQYIVNQNFVPVVDSRGIFSGIITRKVILEEFLKKYQHLLIEKEE